jgi:hypothetical protein
MALEVIFAMGGSFMPTRTVSLGASDERAARRIDIMHVDL